MNCVVISRNGKGVIWRFDSLRSARLHPIPQAWDVFATSPDELVRQYSPSEIESFSKHFEGRDRARLIHAIEEWKVGRPSQLLALDVRELLWDKFIALSAKPPVSSDDILQVIIEDRKALEGKTITSRPEGDSVPHVPKVKGENDMGEKREVFRMADEGKITIGTDDKGVKYSAENNPKRGEKTTEKFNVYKDGMTVAEALAAGLTRSNIRRDRRAGLISIENPPEAPKEAAAEGEGKKGKKGKAADAPAESAGAETPTTV